jgi:hypothetical protein
MRTDHSVTFYVQYIIQLVCVQVTVQSLPYMHSVELIRLNYVTCGRISGTVPEFVPGY